MMVKPAHDKCHENGYHIGRNHVGGFARTGRAGMSVQVHGSNHEESAAEKDSCVCDVVQPVHLHQHTRAARARKSANMFSPNMASVLLKMGTALVGGSWLILLISVSEVSRWDRVNRKLAVPSCAVPIRNSSEVLGRAVRGMAPRLRGYSIVDHDTLV